MTPVLSARGLDKSFGAVVAASGITIEVPAGQKVSLIGSNGAGKTTFLRSLTGVLNPGKEKVVFEGRPIGDLPPNHIVRLGIAMVPEGRKLFPSLTVEENLLMGAYGRRKGPWSLDRVYGLFPILKERRAHPGTHLSGGQQQMVAIGRALMSNPKLMLCDEISLGLAPVVIKGIYDSLPGIAAEGTTLVIVEQDINKALDVSDRVYCFQEGRVSLTGRAGDVTREQIAAAYFGV